MNLFEISKSSQPNRSQPLGGAAVKAVGEHSVDSGLSPCKYGHQEQSTQALFTCMLYISRRGEEIAHKMFSRQLWL